MKLINLAISVFVGLGIVFLGSGLLSRFVFEDRVLPGVTLDNWHLGGLAQEDLSGVLSHYNEKWGKQALPVTLRDRLVLSSIAELGVSIDIDKTSKAIVATSVMGVVSPVLSVNQSQLVDKVEEEFSDLLTLPQNADLAFTTAGKLMTLPGAAGEGIDEVTLKEQLKHRLNAGILSPVELIVVNSPPDIQDNEVEAARSLALNLLGQGMLLGEAETEITVKAFTLRRLIEFVPKKDISDPDNMILGVQFNQEELLAYLVDTVEPAVYQPAIDARFVVDEVIPSGDGLADAPKVSQFSKAQTGLALNTKQTIENINIALDQLSINARLVIEESKPEVADAVQARALGINTLLAEGTSDFVGSPSNRAHNIAVGTSRYHGLLVAPGDEFSFNEYLGPVDAAAGYLPELVIKQNKTIPEYGGGLCQVSTTAFRGALNAGLEITERRNHSYAVGYYGTPGFDATIYPGHTDLRFVNNTPGYILIQAQVAGTKVNFEFWGTDDGREVLVTGPSPYGRQPDGSVRATLKTQVTNEDGETLIDETFYSNYKSPKLYPKETNSISS